MEIIVVQKPNWSNQLPEGPHSSQGRRKRRDLGDVEDTYLGLDFELFHIGHAALDERKPRDCLVESENLLVENQTSDPRVSKKRDWRSIVQSEEVGKKVRSTTPALDFSEHRWIISLREAKRTDFGRVSIESIPGIFCDGAREGNL